MTKRELTNFGREVSLLLRLYSTTQASLARTMDKQPGHLNNTMYGRRAKPTVSWAEKVADALDLPDEDRYRLHLAAARDQGFKL